nr:hypothetical protein [Allomuricauda sp.]
MKEVIGIILFIALGLGNVQNAKAQLGKLGKKVSNKAKTEERKLKKSVSNIEKTGKLPKSGENRTTPKSSPNPTSTNPKQAEIGIGIEDGCKGTDYYFKMARKDLAKIMEPESDDENLSVFEMETVLKRVEDNYLKKIHDRDPNCNTSKLESEIAEAEKLINTKKGGSSFLPEGTYAATGVWESLEFGNVVHGRYSNEQEIEIKGYLGDLKGALKYKSTGETPENVGVEIEGLGIGAIVPQKDESGNIEYYQLAIFQEKTLMAMVFFSNTKSRDALEKIMEQRSKEKVEKANLEPFIKNNLGKVLVSTEGPIYANGKKEGQATATDIELTNSFTFGNSAWVRIITKEDRPPMELLKLIGFPPAGEMGAAIRTRILFDGEEVGQDLFRAVRGDDLKVVNEWKHYREPFFLPNGPAQDAYREGIEGIFSKNPSIGEHTMEIQKWVVNINVTDGKTFPLEVMMATSGPLKIKVTEQGWKTFCNSGSSNYGATTGATNDLSKSLLAAVKREAAKSGWKEKPSQAVHTKSTKVYHEITGKYMYTIHEGYVQSKMPNGARLEQGFQMVDGSYHGTIHGTQRYLPAICN